MEWWRKTRSAIQNPQVLDWAYISSEHRWVRRNASTWIYASPPADFDGRYRSQHSAQRGGLTTVGKYIFVSSGHKMRIIRAYSGAVPGAATYEWTAFDGPALNIEDWAFRDNSVRVQARKLAEFPVASINSIPNDGEQWYTLRARVHKNADGSLTSYDLSHWIEEVVASGTPGAAGGGVSLTGTHTVAAVAADTWQATTITPSAGATLVGVSLGGLAIDIGAITTDSWILGWVDAAVFQAAGPTEGVVMYNFRQGAANARMILGKDASGRVQIRFANEVTVSTWVLKVWEQ